MAKSDFLAICKERGFIHQLTDEDGLGDLLQASSQKGYIGFDCTAPGLHVGSLVPIMLLYWFQQCGHTPIVLMGGGTTKVGDPSGKDESRKLLDTEGIEQNKQAIQTVFAKFIDMNNAQMVDNAEWLDTLNYIEFLRDIGPHFSINRMLTMESVKLRLDREQTLSFLEFNYMILQAYDFVELNKQYGCRIQMGGSDQWGNIVSGIELNRRLGGNELFGLTSPLITTASGAKMGKTAQGAIWLDATMCSPYDYWQFWRNTEDGDVGRFLRLFTTLPLNEIEKLGALQGAEINEAKKVLADEATKLCHGEEAAKAAAETSRKTFEEGTMGDALPEIMVESNALEAGIPAFQLFHQAGLANSGKEARRLIQGGGGKLNDQKIEDETMLISSNALNDDQVIKLSAGKKKHALVKVA
jgi:tyrosyl-tRNA synthetase